MSGLFRFDVGQQLGAVAAGEANIGNHEIVEPLLQSFDSLLAVTSCGNRITFTLQRFLNACAQAGFVFYDKNVDSGFIHAATEPGV